MTYKNVIKKVLSYPRYVGCQLKWGFLLRTSKSGIRLHLGCGQRRLESFVNIDCNYSRATDYVCNVASLPCRENSVERIETYHVIEHIPVSLVHDFIAEWKRVLEPGGVLVMECPDFDKAIKEYINGNIERLFSIYGRQRFPGDAHHWGYNGERIKDLVISVGFRDAKILPAVDYHKDAEPCLRLECKK